MYTIAQKYLPMVREFTIFYALKNHLDQMEVLERGS